jgi:hypothetical protein
MSIAIKGCPFAGSLGPFSYTFHQVRHNLPKEQQKETSKIIENNKSV